MPKPIIEYVSSLSIERLSCSSSGGWIDYKRKSNISMCNELSDRTSGLARVLAEAVPGAEDNITVNDKPVPFIKSSDYSE